MLKAQELGLEFRYEHRNSDGELLSDSGWLENNMTDDGIEEMYDVYFRGAAGPDGGFEIGLNQSNLSQTSSFGDLTEVTGTGYSRKAVSRDNTGFPTLSLDNGDMQVSTLTVTFENTGGAAWDGAVDGFLNSTDSGGETLICYRPLSATRTLQQGDTLDVTIKIKGDQPA